jgi:RNA recognition motif-containing protein
MTKLFVGNLSYQATESDLRAAFEPFGEIAGISIATDRDTGRARGFAFVEMATAEEAAKAIGALNGTALSGRPLTVNEARPKRDRGAGGPRGRDARD